MTKISKIFCIFSNNSNISCIRSTCNDRSNERGSLCCKRNRELTLLFKKGRLDEKTFVLNVEKVIKDKGYSLEVLNKDEVQEVGKLVAKKLGNDCTNDKVFQNEDFYSKCLKFLIGIYKFFFNKFLIGIIFLLEN